MGKLYMVYFSAAGTTKQVMEAIADSLPPMERTEVDLLRNPLTQELCLEREDLLLLGMPVYAGVIPEHCLSMLKYLKGKGGPAILAAVYGNRDYDDALLQMRDLTTEAGFQPIAAGAFVAQHSIFPKVGAGRPDQKDLEWIQEFSKTCSDLLKQPIDSLGQLSVKGSPDYSKRYPVKIPFKPTGNKSCTSCGTCVSICPMKAIPSANPRQTDESLCISCGACIAACPAGARGYHQAAYPAAAVGFGLKCAHRQEPEAFFCK